MRLNLVTVLTRLLVGLLFPAVVGCVPGIGQPIESLPWSNASVPLRATAATSPDEADADLPVVADADELEFRDRIVRNSLDELRSIASEPLVLQAVQRANDSGWQTQQQIDQTDIRWRKTTGVEDALVQKYLMNSCADFLRRAQLTNPNYIELFVMDNKGCVVAESDKTSDYWQGDEEKWTECFNDGQGRVYVGEVEYDQSSRSYVVQISVPILDKHRSTIGAMTVSISSGGRN